VFFKQTQRSYNPLLHLVVPVVGALLFAAALYGSIYPTPPHPLNYTPYITLIWIILGLVVLSMLRSRKPEAVQRIGSILGEEGGDEDDVDQVVAKI
jgi:amino acid transporter